MIDREVIIFQIEDMLSNINKENLLLNGGRVDNGAAFLELMTNVLALLKEQEDLGTEMTNAMELLHKKNERIKKLEEQIETLTRWRMNAGAFD